MNTGSFYYPLPANEPVLNYAPGTQERELLKEERRLKKLNRKSIEKLTGKNFVLSSRH